MELKSDITGEIGSARGEGYWMLEQRGIGGADVVVVVVVGTTTDGGGGDGSGRSSAGKAREREAKDV